MPSTKKILLDMDGVLVDFFGQALKVHGREELAGRWPPGQWSMAEALGISGREFWAPINDLGVGFWAGLPWYSWADEIVEMCEAAGGFVIASSPSRRPASATGKLISLQERFGSAFRDYMLGPSKELLAGTGRWLVDDSDDQVDAFTREGGTAILFPQPWNRDHASAPRRLDRLRERLLDLR